jgi:hypothetical protein
MSRAAGNDPPGDAAAALLRLQRELTTALAGGTPGPVLGIDARRLALMARLAHGKRLGKVARVMPATLGLVAARVPEWIEAFRVECPLHDARSYVNGVEFYRFVCRHLARPSPLPPFTRDLARCEIALAAVAQRVGPPLLPPEAWSGDTLRVRRTPGALLRIVEYDVREMLRARRVTRTLAERRRVHLALVPAAVAPVDEAGTQPRVFEIDDAVFAWVRRLPRFEVVERAEAGHGGWTMIGRLCALGVLEARTLE